MSNRTIRHIYPDTEPGVGGIVMPPPAVTRPELAPLLSVLFLHLDELTSMVLHVTSAAAGTGTTTVARDIAAGAAAAGWCSVALIDAHPAERPRRDIGRDIGRDDGLVDDVERGKEPSLRRSRMGTGQIDVAALSNSGQPVSRIESVRTLYATLRKRYSLVVVDCPAVFDGQQMMVLASAADETILVLEAERSPLSEVARAREALERRGASVMGLVMNKSRSRIPRMLRTLV